MTLDDHLVTAVDQAAKKLHTTRSSFTRKALRESLARFSAARLEQKHRKGYTLHPTSDDEFGLWESEHAWGNA
jgi:metal-responsive CopG/Arc/MetJ family transcriptional regulator